MIFSNKTDPSSSSTFSGNGPAQHRSYSRPSSNHHHGRRPSAAVTDYAALPAYSHSHSSASASASAHRTLTPANPNDACGASFSLLQPNSSRATFDSHYSSSSSPNTPHFPAAGPSRMSDTPNHQQVGSAAAAYAATHRSPQDGGASSSSDNASISSGSASGSQQRPVYRLSYSSQRGEDQQQQQQQPWNAASYPPPPTPDSIKGNGSPYAFVPALMRTDSAPPLATPLYEKELDPLQALPPPAFVATPATELPPSALATSGGVGGGAYGLAPNDPLYGYGPTDALDVSKLTPEQQAVAQLFPRDLDEEGGSLFQTVLWMLRNWRIFFKWRYTGWYALIAFLAGTAAVMTIYHKQIVNWLHPISLHIREVPAGWLVPIAILFALSFPPLFGGEIVAILCGAIYGLWVGFGIVAAGTLAGEVGNFYAFRSLLSGLATKYERKNLDYACLAHIVRDGGFWVILLARFSAIPGHFTTAVFATVGMNIWIFTIAAILSLPKHLTIVYLGVLLRHSGDEAQHEDKVPLSGRVVKYVVIVITVIVTVGALWYLYTKMYQVRPVVRNQLREKRWKMLMSLRTENGTSPDGASYAINMQEIPPTGEAPYRCGSSRRPSAAPSHLQPAHPALERLDSAEKATTYDDVYTPSVMSYAPATPAAGRRWFGSVGNAASAAVAAASSIPRRKSQPTTDYFMPSVDSRDGLLSSSGDSAGSPVRNMTPLASAGAGYQQQYRAHPLEQSGDVAPAIARGHAAFPSDTTLFASSAGSAASIPKLAQPPKLDGPSAEEMLALSRSSSSLLSSPPSYNAHIKNNSTHS